MKKKIIIISFLAIVLCAIGIAFVLSGRSRDAHQDDLLLHLTFNEGSGTVIQDASENLPEKEVNYNLSHAVFKESIDPLWKSCGIDKGCLLFDGNSTYIAYGKNDISIEGSSLSINVWVAPRTFEWDDPNAAANGTDALTGIVSQSNKSKNQGFILGYERFGRLSFQIGTGSEWLSIWTNGDNLQKYAWNLVTATYDAAVGEMCLYLNGVLVASRSLPVGTPIAPAKGRTLLVGRNSEGERLTAGFLNVHSGLMDELKLYSCVLTAEEISDYYNKATVSEIPFEDIWLQNILTDDYTRPQFHGGPYENWMNEPHAPIYYNGKYHLFFQQNMSGSYWRNICWGHFVSDDMVSWKPIKEAITPTENSVVPDGVWSGAATYDKNGIPLLFFTAGNDGFHNVEGLISNQNIGIAYPADLSDPELTDWIIYDDLAVIQKKGQGRTGEFRDPYIWYDGTTWFMFLCTGSTKTTGGAVILYQTDTLELKPDGSIDMDWQYTGVVYEMEAPSKLYGTSWELPIVLPVSNTAGTITKFMFVFSPAPASIADNKIYYYLGNFNKETGKFTPDEQFGNEPRLLDYGCNVFTGPSAMIDPASGDIYMFSIMQDQRSAAEQGASGWAHTVGLARKLWLNDDGTDLNMSPTDALHGLEKSILIDKSNLSLEEANELLRTAKGDMLYLRLELSTKDAASIGIEVKKGGTDDVTAFTYTPHTETITGETNNKGDGASTNYVSGYLPNKNDTFIAEIYIDRSLVEAFFNDYKAISMRAYTESPDSQGICLTADGIITIRRLYVADMQSIFISKEH